MRDFVQQVGARQVPATLWSPPPAGTLRPVVLVSHGGSDHRKSRFVTEMAGALVAHGMHALAIDGPVHGDRRSGPADPLATRDAFLQRWSQGTDAASMVEDWRAVLDATLALPQVDGTAIGWCGLPMGTAFGLPLLAQDGRFAAAAIGMWGLDRDPLQLLRRAAPQVLCPCLFHMCWDDEIFARTAQFELFERLGGERQLAAYPGPHALPQGRRLDDVADFLASRLLPAAERF